MSGKLSPLPVVLCSADYAGGISGDTQYTAGQPDLSASPLIAAYIHPRFRTVLRRFEP